ncbi:type III-B CRISPR module-associated protein Cmr5 [Deinococcus sp. S9]|uniref:type III-B CRISPR module-associated protein Cmr5 n=1 Tax=Deinococcus sp. S9 TaxID=2545754 RepID=UPI00105617D0|nr:type III-B CRISPR module-associated protein Cmr5 [Deinococcus sp. S9]TDE86739.1 type III-B CRISPR module-associated protein Cmr5 [Deinococcus sp. S9]
MTGFDPFAAALNNMTAAKPPSAAAEQRPLTRAQADLKQAVELLEAMNTVSDGVKRNYLRRVKDFPALVMQVGLAQAVAFSVEKAGKSDDDDRGGAHRLLLNHLYAVWRPETQGQPVQLDDGKGREHVLKFLQDLSTAEYRHLTRRTLSAWVYFRRLSESVLDPDGKLGEERP